jgi:hypothetical protein
MGRLHLVTWSCCNLDKGDFTGLGECGVRDIGDEVEKELECDESDNMMNIQQ